MMKPAGSVRLAPRGATSALARPARCLRAPCKPIRAAAAAAAEAAVVKTSKPMNIVFVSTEVSPWSKTGGLGDVVGSLPIELAKRGHKVMSIAPRYDQYAGAWDTSVVINVLGKDVRFFHENKKGVDRVFVDHPDFLAKVWGKTGAKLYGLKSGADFVDNHKRFALFCHSAIQSLSALPFAPGEDCVIVANDWHSALVPVILKTVYQPAGKMLGTKAALCVHNIAFQGRFWPTPMSDIGLPDSAEAGFLFEDGYPLVFNETENASDEKVPVAPKGEKFKKHNWLKAGFLAADKVLTVSPNYAAELTSGADKGVELDSVIRAVGGIEGIVNGMDVGEWNPLKDKFLDLPYDKTNVMEGKAVAKQTLQAEVGLPLDPKAPLFGYIGRLEEQKGVDILLAAVPKLLAKVPNAQIIVLGTGKKKLETAVEAMGDLSPKIAGVVKFSEPVAHLITAGADFLLVPSRFEPCGLIQLHAMQYGTVPIVASTGGLVDTVKEGVTGFHIGELDADTVLPADVEALVATVARAAEAYGTPAYASMVKNCISQDLSWAEPAKKWEAILEELKFGPSAASAGESKGKKDAVVTPKVAMDVKGTAKA